MNKGLTGHVPALGVLLIIHGVLMLLMAMLIVLAGAGVIISGVSQGEDVPPLIGAGCCYGVMFLCGVVGGALQVYGGLSAYKWKRIGAVRAAVFASIGALALCYCTLTGVALMVWGLIVLNDDAVKERFASSELPDHPLAV